MKFSTQLKAASVLASLALLSACSPNGNSAADGNGLTARNIIGGTLSDSAFQKANGVVGLIMVSVEAPPQAANDNESASASGDRTAAAPGSGDSSAAAQPQPRVSISICTGSLLAKRKVLTAAHCVMSPNLRAVLVFFKTDLENANPETDAIRALAAHVHPDYNPRGGSAGTPSFETTRSDSDMVMLTLEKDAPADFKLAKLPTAEATPRAQEKLTLAGYGVTNPIVNQLVVNIITGQIGIRPVESTGSGVLRQVDNIEVLQETDDKKEFLLSGYAGERGACHGDSGGPAYRKESDGTYTLLGVTSRGTNPIGNCDRDAVYGSVAGQLDWIRSAL